MKNGFNAAATPGPFRRGGWYSLGNSKRDPCWCTQAWYTTALRPLQQAMVHYVGGSGAWPLEMRWTRGGDSF